MTTWLNDVTGIPIIAPTTPTQPKNPTLTYELPKVKTKSPLDNQVASANSTSTSSRSSKSSLEKKFIRGGSSTSSALAKSTCLGAVPKSPTSSGGAQITPNMAPAQTPNSIDPTIDPTINSTGTSPDAYETAIFQTASIGISDFSNFTISQELAYADSNLSLSSLGTFSGSTTKTPDRKPPDLNQQKKQKRLADLPLGAKQNLSALCRQPPIFTAKQQEEIRSLLKKEGEGDQDDLYPYFHMVQWSYESAKSDVVMTWDLHKVYLDCNTCLQTPKAFLRWAEVVKRHPEILELQEFSLDEGEYVFVSWAEALLESLSQLKEIRFQIVPRYMNEELFWRRYFAIIKGFITEEIFDVIEQQGIDCGERSPQKGRCSSRASQRSHSGDSKKSRSTDSKKSRSESLGSSRGGGSKSEHDSKTEDDVSCHKMSYSTKYSPAYKSESPEVSIELDLCDILDDAPEKIAEPVKKELLKDRSPKQQERSPAYQPPQHEPTPLQSQQTPQYDAPKYDVPKRDLPKYDVKKYNIPQEEGKLQAKSSTETDKFVHSFENKNEQQFSVEKPEQEGLDSQPEKQDVRSQLEKQEAPTQPQQRTFTSSKYKINEGNATLSSDIKSSVGVFSVGMLGKTPKEKDGTKGNQRDSGSSASGTDSIGHDGIPDATAFNNSASPVYHQTSESSVKAGAITLPTRSISGNTIGSANRSSSKDRDNRNNRDPAKVLFKKRSSINPGDPVESEMVMPGRFTPTTVGPSMNIREPWLI